jgi:hypothetical protein
MDDIEEIQAELSQLPSKEGEIDSSAHETIAKLGLWRHGKDRSFIVRWIVVLYVFAIALCLIFLFIQGIYYREDVFSNISEIIKIAVLPVVTLAIGYYFALSKSE